MSRALFGAAATAALVLLGLPGSVARAETPPQVLDELVVTGERTGPGLWHVHRGGAELWILGTVEPLPKDMTWQSAQLEHILDRSRQVLVVKPFGIGIARGLWWLLTKRDLFMVHGGKKLKDVMPPDLHGRFAVQRAKYTADDGKWERYRPFLATVFLQGAAIEQVGLSTRLDLTDEVRKLARKHRVQIAEVKLAGIADVLDALKTIPPATENACVAAGLATVESGMPRLVARAQAWATGDIERMQSLPEPAEVDGCRAALMADAGAGDLVAQVRRAWLDGLDESLRGGGVTVAVVSIDLLLERDGLLDGLRGLGYEVAAPN